MNYIKRMFWQTYWNVVIKEFRDSDDVYLNTVGCRWARINLLKYTK